ncbi:uncharacterized protein LOC122033759 [Zingiber officinale]|uniref:uncharacterized protein LOC122033759 n=1 Tax=Zingiber officinale TaxID=94328 RepID=UPI001C4D07D6|nr:uncharacterized protein LOC122033759 [Zingiber officinale]
MEKTMEKTTGSGGKGPASTSAAASASAGSRNPLRESRNKSSVKRPASSSDPDLSKSKTPSSSSLAIAAKDHPHLPPDPAPTASTRPFSLPDSAGILPPSPYGFRNLERRTIVLSDASVRSYFALPLDAPVNPAADRLPFGRQGFVLGPEPNPRLGLESHLHLPPGRRLSPEGFRQPPPYVRGPDLRSDYWDSLGLDGPRSIPDGSSGPLSLKRRYGDEDEFLPHRQPFMQHGNLNGIPIAPSGSSGSRMNFLEGSQFGWDAHDELSMSKQARLIEEGHELPPKRVRPNEVPPAVTDVDPHALRKAFLRFSKMINESPDQRKKYLNGGKDGPLPCVVCRRASKGFAEVHSLVMHTYNAQNADLRVDHLGLHKALCVLMGWNYKESPENSKAYQLLSADEAQANRDDLILWPPTVVLHNTSSGRKKDGHVEGMGNKEIDNRLKEMGFTNCKAKSIYGKGGHTGITVVKFAKSQAGLKEAERLAEHFEKENHGRRGWAHVQDSLSAHDEKNPALVKVDGKNVEHRILYGYLGSAADLEKMDQEMRKKTDINSRRDLDLRN